MRRRESRGIGAAILLSGSSLLVSSLACRDLDRFDTGEDGAYCGAIVDGEFARRGYARGLELRLTLDVDRLDTMPGTLHTNDAETGPCAPRPTFDAAPLRVTRELWSDPLSRLDLGGGRDFNLVAWVDSTCRGSALSVVSLMHSGDVEVRLLSRAAEEDAESSGHFAVFPLERDACP